MAPARYKLCNSTRLFSAIPALTLSACAWIAGAAESLPVDDRDPQIYRQFAMTHDGDASRGRALFADEQKLGCVKCHSVDGRGSKAGPDLATAGDTFSRRELIEAVLSPSASIAVGYSTTSVETKSGDEFQGVLKEVTDSWLELMGGDGRRVRIANDDIQERRGGTISLMPEGLHLGVSQQEFADLMEYLVSLKQPTRALSNHRGMPEIIPLLEPAVSLRPLLQASLTVPPPGEATNLQLGLVWFGQLPNHSNTYLAMHQAGRIWRIQKKGSGITTSIFADFTPEVFSSRGPNGLLGLAFHPRFQQNRKYYLKHQVLERGKITTLIEERQAASDLAKDSGSPARLVMRIESVAEHHNGGCIQFGPDGYLYIGMGDSAPNFDPQGYGQNLGLLFGKMLRIDVDHKGAGLPYAIPADNPFVGQPGKRPEIWAYGLREPWRFSFDSLTGDLWVADLGQERGDELDLVHRGENYGWNVYEGFELFSNDQRIPGMSYVPPLFSTHRKDGACMIGGYVYRGDPHSTFYGVYIFGDHQSKKIWGLTQSNGFLKRVCQLATCPQSITAFATDERGNIYAVGYQGMIYQLDLTSAKFETSEALQQAHAIKLGR